MPISYYTVEEIDALIAGLPVAKDGEDGIDGQDGKDGEDGKDGISPPASGGEGYGLWLDSFTGSDDDKLSAAMAQTSADTVKRPILLANRKYTFAQARTINSGFKLINPYGFGNQQRGANSIPCHLNYTGSGKWFTLGSAQVFDVEFTGFGATSTTGTAQFLSSGTNVLWTSKLHDLGFLNWNGVMGSTSEKFLNTAIETSGWWNVNNARGTQFHFGGSDSRFFTDGMLIDTNLKQTGSDQYLMKFSYQQKSDVGGLYMTSDNMKGIYVAGSVTDGQMVFDKLRLEGRNAGAPSDGLLTVQSGRVRLINSWVGFANTGAMINQSGGYLAIDGCDFGKATSFDTATPVLTQTGGTARVSNVTSNWGGKPVVKGGNIKIDDTATLI